MVARAGHRRHHHPLDLEHVARFDAALHQQDDARHEVLGDVLHGEADADGLLLRPAGFYASSDIALRLERRVTGIDRAARTVLLACGEAVAYDRLILALGSLARTLDVPGAELHGALSLRSAADADRLQAALRERGLPWRHPEHAAQHLAHLRQAYEPYLTALAAFLRTPLPQWLPARDAPDNWQTSGWEVTQRTDG